MFFFGVFDVALQYLHNFRALRKQNRQALSDARVGHKVAQFSPKLVVIALFGLLEAGKIGVKLRFFIESRAVNSGEHLVVFVALPVGSRKPRKLEGFDFSRRNEVRTFAKLSEIALSVKHRPLVFGHTFDNLNLIVLVKAFHNRKSFLFGDGFFGYRQISLDDFAHFRLDFLKILAGNRRFEFEIVVKSVLYGRPQGKLDGRVNVLHRHRKNVSAGMTIDVFSVLVRKRYRRNRTIRRQNVGKLRYLTVNSGGNGGFIGRWQIVFENV